MESGGWTLRTPCAHCGSNEGRIEPRGGQNCVFCAGCNRHLYNAPKSETGEKTRSIRTRPEIKPSQRARVLDRDSHRCVSCGSTDRALHIGHLVSVDAGIKLGMTESDLYDDENLATICEECNLGMGSRSVNPRLMWRLLQARKAAG